MNVKNLLQSLFIAILLSGCQFKVYNSSKETVQTQAADQQSVSFDIQYEQFTLDNGLNVILHEDHSDPIVAFATIVHVGSNREKPGRTGFAHFFEHMAFNNSENVPMGANRKMIPELGGSRNGGTWSDGTIYYEVVPTDAFEKLMWIDSDRFGYMINTVTEGTLEREKQVVKNEKRQRVDNRPYGHTGHVIRKNLYPQGHPYNWTVIGDLEDLQNATLEDVREFYDTYYVPSNATLVIAGDIDPVKTKQSVQNWFGEIKAGEAVEDMQSLPVSLKADKKLYHLDNFAKLPEIRMTFPTVEQYHPDSYALDALASILADGKESALYSQVVEEDQLAPEVSVYQSSDELAGTFTIQVRGNSGVDLDDIYESIHQALEEFESQPIRDNDLKKIKAEQETGFYSGISSVLNKAFQLGIYNEYAGSPDFIKQDIQNILDVEKADILRVYKKYIQNKPAIITSFVPKDSFDLTLEGSSKANVVEEQIIEGKEQQFEEELNPDFVKTETKFDRSEPPLGEPPVFKTPKIWREHTKNSIPVIGIEHNELPLVYFNLRINGGQRLDDSDKIGTAVLLADLLMEGTEFKTAAELEDAIGLLGSSLSVRASKSGVFISGSSLAKNFAATMQLLTEMVLHPRFDESDFDRLKASQLTQIKDASSNPNSVANLVFMRQLYGDDHILGQATGGSIESVTNITIDDVKSWYANYLTGSQASFRVVGDVKPGDVLNALTQLDENWHYKQVNIPEYQELQPINSPKVYFVDIPGAKQSAIYIGKPTVKRSDADFNKLNIVNNRLGSGSSARLTQILRIQKGYTYGAYSGIRASEEQSPFVAATQVRSNVTLESLQILKEQIGNYASTFLTEDLQTTKNLITKGNTRKFETLSQLLSVVNEIDSYQLEDSYLDTNQKELEDLSLTQAHDIINTHLNEQQMIYVIVGDAETQLAKVKEFGYGDPVLLDREGNSLSR